MEYPFAHKEYKIYTNTFLQNVLVEWYYTSSDKEIDISLLKEFFKDNFNIELPSEKDDLFPVMIGSTDQCVNLYFGKDAFKLRVGIDAYRGFKNLKQFFDYGTDFLEILHINEIKNVKVRKINIWPYENVGSKKTSKDVLLRKIFSKELLEGDMIQSLNNVSQSLWDKCFDNQEQAEKMCIKYGFNSNYEGYKDLMILDTYVKRTRVISNSDIIDNLLQMNQVLFDEYHWSVNQNIIEIMVKYIVK